MDCVYVEQGQLDGGTGVIFRLVKGGVRMMYDPDRATQAGALAELRLHLPQVDGAQVVCAPCG